MDLLTNLACNVFSLLCLAAIALCALGCGRLILRHLGLENRTDPVGEIAWSLGVGFASAGTVVTVLGLCGLLFRPAIIGLTLVGTCWGAGELAQAIFQWQLNRARRAQEKPEHEVAVPYAHPARWLNICVGLLISLVLVCTLLKSLAPPTAGDALCYHLELPKVFLQQHGLKFLPFHDNATYPLLVEMLFAWGLSLDGPVTAQLVHWMLGVVLFLATVHLARDLVGAPWSWLAGCALLCVPAVFNQMPVAMNDVALAAFTTLAISAVRRLVIDDDERSWLFAAAIVLGAALATKYLAIIYLLAVVATLMLIAARNQEYRRPIIIAALVLLVGASATASVWYVRAAWHRGNPTFPFFSAQAQASDAALPITTKRASGWSLLSLASAPWDITMHPEQYGGRGHRLGPLWLMGLPLLIFVRRLRGLALLVLVATIYLGAWYALRQNSRFMLPILPLFCVGLTWVWIELQRFPRPQRALAIACLMLAMSLDAMASARGLRDKAALLTGRESREQFLLRSEPSYAAAQLANQLPAISGKILSQDYRMYYFQTPVVREAIYRRDTNYHEPLATANNAAEFSRKLLDQGFGCLLLAESPDAAGIGFNATLSQLVDRHLESDPGASNALVKISDYQFCDSDGAWRRYRLVLLR